MNDLLRLTIKLETVNHLLNRLAAYSHLPTCPCSQRVPLDQCNCHIGLTLQLLEDERREAERQATAPIPPGFFQCRICGMLVKPEDAGTHSALHSTFARMIDARVTELERVVQALITPAQPPPPTPPLVRP